MRTSLCPPSEFSHSAHSSLIVKQATGPPQAIRVRRWNQLHFAGYRQTMLDVVRVDDPASTRPLLMGTRARKLTSEEMRSAYGDRPAGGNELLCGAGHHGHGDATGVE